MPVLAPLLRVDRRRGVVRFSSLAVSPHTLADDVQQAPLQRSNANVTQRDPPIAMVVACAELHSARPLAGLNDLPLNKHLAATVEDRFVLNMDCSVCVVGEFRQNAAHRTDARDTSVITQYPSIFQACGRVGTQGHASTLIR